MSGFRAKGGLTHDGAPSTHSISENNLVGALVMWEEACVGEAPWWYCVIGCAVFKIFRH